MIVMKLQTKEIISNFENYPFHSQKKKDFNAERSIR